MTPETGKGKPRQNVGIVAGGVTKKVSVGKRRLIQTDPDLGKPNKSTTIALHKRVRKAQNRKGPILGDEAQCKFDEEEHLEIK